MDGGSCEVCELSPKPALSQNMNKYQLMPNRNAVMNSNNYDIIEDVCFSNPPNKDYRRNSIPVNVVTSPTTIHN
jgi:hypothetical protein